LVVLCAGSTLLLVQSKALDEAPNKLSGAIAKLAGITFTSLAFSYWFDKPWFLTEGKLAAVLIIPSSWGSQLGGHLHQHPHRIQFAAAARWGHDSARTGWSSAAERGRWRPVSAASTECGGRWSWARSGPRWAMSSLINASSWIVEGLGMSSYTRTSGVAVPNMVEVAFPSVGDGRPTSHGASLIPLLVLAVS
jgi:hypothetical protein